MSKESFFDRYGLLHVEPGIQSENGILHLAIFNLKGGFVDDYSMERIIREHRLNYGLYKQSPWNNKRIAGRDNILALMSMSYHYNLTYHKKLRILKHTQNLGDIGYLAYLKYGNIASPLLIFTAGFSILSMLENKQFKHMPKTIWTQEAQGWTFPNGKPSIIYAVFGKIVYYLSFGKILLKNIQIRPNRVSGKQLAYLRFKTIKNESIIMNMAWKICSWIIVDWEKVFVQYYKNKFHPNRKQ